MMLLQIFLLSYFHQSYNCMEVVMILGGSSDNIAVDTRQPELYKIEEEDFHCGFSTDLCIPPLPSILQRANVMFEQDKGGIITVCGGGNILNVTKTNH